MNEEDIKELITQLTVRIEGKEKGTGVLLLQDNKAHVLTVYHCIYGKKVPFHKADINDMTFSFIDKICSEKIKPLNILPLKENLVLMEIDINQLKKTDIKCLYLDRAYDGKQYYLRGFPNSEVHNFTATCNDKDFDEVTFKIDIDRLTSDTLGESANTYVGGLSGSGVFFSENNQLYLVGLTNELRDRYARFDSVHCTKLVDLKETIIPLSQRVVFKNKNINIDELETENLPYINQLIKSYNSVDITKAINTCKEIDNSQYSRHFNTARKSFNMIEQLRLFSRDNLLPNAYQDFQDEVYEYIINTVEKEYDNAYTRVTTTEDKSLDMDTEFYPIEQKKCKKIEKKGVCHHLVNDKEFNWIKDE